MSVQVPAWVAGLTDSGVRAALLLVAVAAAGLAGVGLAWSGVAATLYPQLQMPYLVSGGIGGLALTGACLAVTAVHLERRSTASERAALDDLTISATELADALPATLQAAMRRAQPAKPVRSRTRRQAANTQLGEADKPSRRRR